MGLGIEKAEKKDIKLDTVMVKRVNNIFVPSEEHEQMRLVEYVKHKYPDLLFTSSLGGVRVSIGVAVKMKKLGYRKSWPDLSFAEARGGYFGLYIELKNLSGRLDPDQKDFLITATERGYFAQCAIGYHGAVHIIDRYMGMPRTEKV